MAKWEYCIIDRDNHKLKMPSFGEIELIDIKGRDIATLINELGADCWEMIGTGTQSEGDYHALYFKRPIE